MNRRAASGCSRKRKGRKVKRIVHGIIFRLQCLMEYIYCSIQKAVRSISRKNVYMQLKRFKDIHRGERIFLIGTGSSLTDEDVLKLRNEYTFSVNSFAKATGLLNFYPTYYLFTDGEEMSMEGEDVLGQKGTIIFFPQRKGLERKYYEILSRKDNAYEFLMKDSGNWANFLPPVPTKFSYDIAKEIIWGRTCMYAAMQVIAYMGFSEVYLLGMDCIMPAGVRNYMEYRDEKDIGEGGYLVGHVINQYVDAWKGVKKHTEILDMKIYNATRGGELEVFPRVDLDEVV